MSSPTVSVEFIRKPVEPDVEVSALWVYPMITPCELVPLGAPGILLATDARGQRNYAVLVLGKYDRKTQELTIDGYRVLTDKGEVHDIAITPHGPECNCGDHTFRLRRCGCRHVQMLRAVGELPELEPLEPSRKVVEGRLVQPAQLEAAEGDGFDNP